jgi:hypothetical protein
LFIKLIYQMSNAEPKGLKQEIILKIKTDIALANGVASKLEIDFWSLPMYLKRNSRRLTEGPVLNYLSEQLNIPILDLVYETNVKLIA